MWKQQAEQSNRQVTEIFSLYECSYDHLYWFSFLHRMHTDAGKSLKLKFTFSCQKVMESGLVPGKSWKINQIVALFLTCVHQNLSINQSISQSKAICIALPTNNGRRRLTVKWCSSVVVQFLVTLHNVWWHCTTSSCCGSFSLGSPPNQRLHLIIHRTYGLYWRVG